MKADAIDPGFMVTSKIKLPDFVEHGIRRLQQDPGSTVKILVDLMGEDDTDRQPLAPDDG
jgi:hypothetical protein